MSDTESSKDEMLDQGEQREHNQTFNFFCWVFQLTIWVLLIFCFVLNLMESGYVSEDSFLYEYLDPKHLKKLYIILGICYFIYLVLEFSSPTSSYLRNKKTDQAMYETMGDIFKTPPEITFYGESYHYVTRIVTTTDSKGRVHTQTRREKVTTHRDSYDLPYYSSRDVSGLFYLNCEKAFAQKKRYIKLKLKEEINFADAISYSDYEKEKEAFWLRNRFRDTYFDFSESRDVPGMKHHNLVRLTKTEPAAVRFSIFLIYTIIGLSELYKAWIDSLCVYQKFKIRKLVSTRYNLNKPMYEELIPQLDVIVQKYQYKPEYYNYINPECHFQKPSQAELDEAKKYQNKIPNYQVSTVNGYPQGGVVIDNPGYSYYDATQPPTAFASLSGEVGLEASQLNANGLPPTGFGQPGFKFNTVPDEHTTTFQHPPTQPSPLLPHPSQSQYIPLPSQPPTSPNAPPQYTPTAPQQSPPLQYGSNVPPPPSQHAIDIPPKY